MPPVLRSDGTPGGALLPELLTAGETGLWLQRRR
jgi:hypothetical protein